MTDRTQHVIDAIDGALDDWSVGPDAMRWTPEPERHSSPRLAFRGPIVLHTAPAETDPRDAAAWQPVRGILERSIWWTPPTIDEEQARRLRERINGALLPVMEAAERMAASMGVSFQELADHLSRALPMEPLTDPRPADDEDPQERALRLRQQRNTGPSRDLTRQRRPRRLP